MTKTFDFENEPKIGNGIYTAADIASILKMPQDRVRYWMRVYWDGKLGKEYGQQYSWNVNGNRAVSFRTMVEFYVMTLFGEAGVPPQNVLLAHKELMETHQTAFPFASKQVLDDLRTSGKLIYQDINGEILTLNGSKQLALPLIRELFSNLDFNEDRVASKFWPMGKDHAIVVDPKRKFGKPVLSSSNIYPEVLHNHYLAGDTIPFLADAFQVPQEHVEDAIAYCKMVA